MLTARRGVFAAGVTLMHWWVVILIVAAIPLTLYGLYRWASGDPGIEAGIAKERLREEQDWRSVRRAGKDATRAEREGLRDAQ